MTVKIYSDRAWALPAVFAIVGTAVAIAGVLVVIGELRGVSIHGPAMAGGVIATLFGGGIGYLGIAAIREGGTYLLVDVPAGVVHHRRARKRETYPLAELGALAVVKQPPKERYGRRGPQATVWELRAERVQRPLAESMSREAVEERSAMLAGLVLHSAVRNVLVAPSGEGALRSPPDDVGEVRRIAGERAGEVLSALEHDPDREVAARAAQVRARLG